jgi:hypothetical protein
MVRAPLVDKQCDSERLLDALSPLLQAFLDGLYFSFEGLRGLNQFRSFLWMFSAGESNLSAEFGGSSNQLPHRLFRFLDLIDRPLGHTDPRAEHDLTILILSFSSRPSRHFFASLAVKAFRFSGSEPRIIPVPQVA